MIPNLIPNPLMGYALWRRPPNIAHCSRIADSRHCCKRILAFRYTNLLFRMIGSFTLVSWGTLGFFWDTREHNKGHFEVQAWISTDFWCYLACLEPLLWRPGGPWDDPGAILGRSWEIGGHKEGPCEVQAWILPIFC